MDWLFENSRTKDHKYGLWLIAHNAELIPIIRHACTQAHHLEKKYGSLQSSTANLRVVDDAYEAERAVNLNDVIDDLEQVEVLKGVVVAWKEARNIFFNSSENLLSAVNEATPMAEKFSSWSSRFARSEPADITAIQNVTSSVKAHVRALHDLKSTSINLVQKAINHTSERIYMRGQVPPFSRPHDDPARLDFDYAAHALSNFYSHPLGRIKKHPRRLAGELKKLEERSQHIPR